VKRITSAAILGLGPDCEGGCRDGSEETHA
jgi:hypothetical protein